MNLHEIFMQFIPALSVIFEMGYIPSPSEFYELTDEQYNAYQRQSGDKNKPLYTIIPQNYKYLEPSNEISIVTKEEMSRIGKAAIFLYLYAEEGGCDSQKSEDVLRFVAERIPRCIADGTKFQRSSFKALKPGEVSLSDKGEWSDFLASLMGEGMALNVKVTYRDTGKTEEISMPIKKLR